MEDNNGMKVIGKYSYFLSSCLGAGSFGKVFEGFENTTKAKVAIKKVDFKVFEKDSYLQKAIYSQIKILNKLKHPNVVELFDVLNSKRSLYIVTEFCQHGDLKRYLKKKGRLTETEAYIVMQQIAQGFKELVKEKVIHRDLKPANILIHNNVYKICDFGFSKFVDSSLDTLRSCVGSPIYMAPQILDKQKYTYKCDVWSLGIIYFELLHGSVPWKGVNQMDLLKNIKTVKLRITEGFSEPVVKFLGQLLCYEEDKRASWEDVFTFFTKKSEVLIKQPSLTLQPLQISSPKGMISPKAVIPKGKIILTKYFFEQIAFRSLACVNIHQKLHKLRHFNLSRNLSYKVLLLLSWSIKFKCDKVKGQVDRLHDALSQYCARQQFSHYSLFLEDMIFKLKNSQTGQDLSTSTNPEWSKLLDSSSMLQPETYESLLKQSLTQFMDQLSEELVNTKKSDRIMVEQILQSLTQMLKINQYYVKNGQIPYDKIFRDKDVNKSDSRSSSKQIKKISKSNSFFV